LDIQSCNQRLEGSILSASVKSGFNPFFIDNTLSAFWGISRSRPPAEPIPDTKGGVPTKGGKGGNPLLIVYNQKQSLKDIAEK
jgi:hypothetical protein